MFSSARVSSGIEVGRLFLKRKSRGQNTYQNKSKENLSRHNSLRDEATWEQRTGISGEDENQEQAVDGRSGEGRHIISMRAEGQG